MAKPIPGKPYTVVSGDNLSKIANKAYGDSSKWRIIWQANQSTVRSDDPNKIFPGEVLVIPPDPTVAEANIELGIDAPDLKGKDKDEFTLVISDTEIKTESANIKRTIDTASDGWSAVSYWDFNLKSISDIIKPYNYAKAAVYLGGRMIVNGFLYVVSPQLTPDGNRLILKGFSKTVDIVDSTLKPPYELNNITLDTRVKDLVTPLGIGVKIDAPMGDKFNRVTAEPTETIFEHCAKLASQRSVLISSTRTGDLILWQAKKSKPVGSIQESAPPRTEMLAEFDGRQRFNSYKAIGQTPKNNKITAVSKDNNVPKSRFLTFQANESTKGTIQGVADWRRSKQLADALTIPFPVDSWYAPDGNLWEVNTIVTAVIPSLWIDYGFDFLIKSVEYISSADGTPAILELVPPQVYAGEDLVEPWFEASLF
jgi:prophage tail gpP-like protein